MRFEFCNNTYIVPNTITFWLEYYIKNIKQTFQSVANHKQIMMYLYIKVLKSFWIKTQKVQFKINVEIKFIILCF